VSFSGDKLRHTHRIEERKEEKNEGYKVVQDRRKEGKATR
jgi:hypothetical protein